MLVLCVSALGCNLGAQQSNIIGNQAFQNGNHLQALSRFQQSLNQNPNNPDANYNLAAIFYSLGKSQRNPQYLAQSEQLYRKAIGLDGQHAEAHRGLTALLVVDGNSVRALRALGRMRESQGQSLLALDNYMRALQIDGGQVDVAQRVAALQQQYSRTGGTPTQNLVPRYGSATPWQTR